WPQGQALSLCPPSPRTLPRPARLAPVLLLAFVPWPPPRFSEALRVALRFSRHPFQHHPSFTVLYAPQPLLPLLAAELGVGCPAASLLITVTLLPLSIAPVAYGFMLESVS